MPVDRFLLCLVNCRLHQQHLRSASCLAAAICYCHTAQLGSYGCRAFLWYCDGM